jgi:protein phosphatase
VLRRPDRYAQRRQLETLFEENLPLAQLQEALIEAANAAGGKDNIGVVLIEQDA